MIRKNLASLLLAVKTEIGFFPNLPNYTPEEIFLNHNDIEFVKESKTKLIYVYDYDMMVYDLNSNYSWARLPTEFLLMAISRIYQVEILIYHNKTDFINKINIWNNYLTYLDHIEKIRLGQINEEHYFPLLELPDELKNNKDVVDEIINTDVKYDDNKKKFIKWSKIMIESINFVNKFNKNNNTNDIDNFNSNQIDLSENYTIKNNRLNNIDLSDTNNTKIMKTNHKLTKEQINDYNQISNFDEFKFV